MRLNKRRRPKPRATIWHADGRNRAERLASAAVRLCVGVAVICELARRREVPLDPLHDCRHHSPCVRVVLLPFCLGVRRTRSSSLRHHRRHRRNSHGLHLRLLQLVEDLHGIRHRVRQAPWPASRVCSAVELQLTRTVTQRGVVCRLLRFRRGLERSLVLQHVQNHLVSRRIRATAIGALLALHNGCRQGRSKCFALRIAERRRSRGCMHPAPTALLRPRTLLFLRLWLPGLGRKFGEQR